MVRSKIRDRIRLLVLLLLLIPTYYPMAMMLSNSFKTTADYYTHPLGLPTHWDVQNFAAAWSGIAVYFWNTLFVGAVSVALGVSAAAMSAFVFARYRFPGREVIYALYLGLLMIPSLFVIIGLFLEIKTFSLLDTWWSLILPYAAGSQAFGVFILRTFFASLPEELFEAARADGARESYIFLRIAVPLAAPSLGTVAILAILGVWNDYLWPTVALNSAHMFTISAGIFQFASSFGIITPGGQVFAAYLIGTLPVVLLIGLTMRYYLSGVIGGALKL